MYIKPLDSLERLFSPEIKTFVMERQDLIGLTMFSLDVVQTT